MGHEFQCGGSDGASRKDGAARRGAQVGVRAGFVQGLTVGSIFCIAFCAYALALWYGSRLIIAGGINGGQVSSKLATRPGTAPAPSAGQVAALRVVHAHTGALWL